MISEKTLNLDWINTVSRKNRNADKILIEKAVVHAAKAAYLSKLIELNENKLEPFENALQVTNWTIEQPFFTRLNRLRKSNPQAFFYWYKTYELVKGILPK